MNEWMNLMTGKGEICEIFLTFKIIMKITLQSYEEKEI